MARAAPTTEATILAMKVPIGNEGLPQLPLSDDRRYRILRQAEPVPLQALRREKFHRNMPVVGIARPPRSAKQERLACGESGRHT